MKIVWDAPRFCLYSFGFAKNCFLVHSYNAQAKDCMHICNVVGVDGAIFYGFISHYIVELSVLEGMLGHELGLARGDGVRDFALGKTLVALQMV
jgi:hypothetical protein